MIIWERFQFYHKTKHKAVDKTLEAMYPERIEGHMQKSGGSEIKQQKTIQKDL